MDTDYLHRLMEWQLAVARYVNAEYQRVTGVNTADDSGGNGGGNPPPPPPPPPEPTLGG